jgi:hypothetical protein
MEEVEAVRRAGLSIEEMARAAGATSAKIAAIGNACNAMNRAMQNCWLDEIARLDMQKYRREIKARWIGEEEKVASHKTKNNKITVKWDDYIFEGDVTSIQINQHGAFCEPLTTATIECMNWTTTESHSINVAQPQKVKNRSKSDEMWDKVRRVVETNSKDTSKLFHVGADGVGYKIWIEKVDDKEIGMNQTLYNLYVINKQTGEAEMVDLFTGDMNMNVALNVATMKYADTLKEMGEPEVLMVHLEPVVSYKVIE